MDGRMDRQSVRWTDEGHSHSSHISDLRLWWEIISVNYILVYFIHIHSSKYAAYFWILLHFIHFSQCMVIIRDVTNLSGFVLHNSNMPHLTLIGIKTTKAFAYMYM